MKYMLLMQATKKNWDTFMNMPTDDIKAHIGFMRRVNEELAKSGEMVIAHGLAGPDDARIVQAKAGGAAPIVSDGPFPEAKEFLAGWWIVDVESADRATAIAAHISTAPGVGGVPMNFPVEVRQVMSAPPVDV